MKIKWNRIVAIGLLALSLYLWCKMQPFLKNIWEVTHQDWGYDSPMKSIMLGVLCLTFLAAIKLLTRK